MKKHGQIKYPYFINECAAYIGKLRNLTNYDLKLTYTKYDRGYQNEVVDILGVQGELIFCYYLDKLDIPYTSTKLLSNKPLKEPDVIVKGKKIDVKAVRKTAKFLAVNQEAHKKDKGVDTYVFIRVDDYDNATYWVYSYDEVDSWQVKKLTYTNAYILPI